jgi:hypothetical protein
MLRHYEIAEDFLKRFWLPGNAQLRQGLANGEQLLTAARLLSRLQV